MESDMLPARTFSITIARDWRALYEIIWRPEYFPRWASGLAESGLRQEGAHWLADGPEGPIRIRFTPHNVYGVMDHHVDLGNGEEVFVPLRVVQNGEGAEVMLTLFRQPDMDDDRFAADIRWINRDLKALKALIES
ncbi:polyketide cyclase [Sphingobium fuliginis]|nr:polyketide cyclase [Sphingobium fuliginis]